MSLQDRLPHEPVPIRAEVEIPSANLLNPVSPFVGAAPKVTLLREESTTHPFSVAIAAAWSCYGGKPAKVDNVRKLIGPAPEGLSDEKAADREGRQSRALRLYSDLFAAGHHTTLQHASFTFVLDNVSRLAIWSFFHSHPFYNSEQVSQRYREVTGETMLIPDLPAREQQIFADAIERALQGYRRLVEILTPDLARDYARIFPARSRERLPQPSRGSMSAVQKRAQEVARYVLPLATPSHLYHTVSGLTLLRYHVLANQPDAPAEVRYIVDRMIDEVLAVDPYLPRCARCAARSPPLRRGDSIEAKAFDSWHESLSEVPNEAFFLEFDAALGTRQHSRLAGFDPKAETTMASAIRTVLGPSVDRAERRGRDCAGTRPAAQSLSRASPLPRHELEAHADDEPHSLHLPEADQWGGRCAESAPSGNPLVRSVTAGSPAAQPGRHDPMGYRAQSGGPTRI